MVSCVITHPNAQSPTENSSPPSALGSDVNREHTRSAAIPAIILELLRRILRLDSSGEHDDAPVETEWRLDQLLFLRAATGALLNMSLDFSEHGVAQCGRYRMLTRD